MDRLQHRIAVAAGLLLLACLVQVMLIRRATVPGLDAVHFVESAQRIDTDGENPTNCCFGGADRKTLEFNQFTPHDLDQIRVLTAVPVPAAVWLFGSGLGLLGWMRRRGAAKA